MGEPNQTTIRKRVVPSTKAHGNLLEIWTSSHPTDVPGTQYRQLQGDLEAAAYQGKQVTVSENHPQWRSVRRSTSDIGGEFLTEKWEVSAPRGKSTITRDRIIDQWRRRVTTYRGPLWAVDRNNLSSATNSLFGFPAGSYTSDSVLKALGSEAIANVKPTNSIADLSTFLGEVMREGLPALAGATLFKPDKVLEPKKGLKIRDDLKNLSGEHLNYQFGWLPIMSDMQAFAEALAHVKEVYNQYLRDSGRVVRRRYVFPTITQESVTQLGTNQRAKIAVSTSDLLTPLAEGKIVRVDKTTRRRWFSGAFTYYMPPLDSRGFIEHYGSIADKLLGTTIDPSTIWNLAPWSWAIDWFSNIGDVLDNVSDYANDGLVLRWGYMMETTIIERTFNLVGPSGYVGNPPASPVVVRYVAKRRVKANPFGFGITWQGLSPRQISILTALGISRKG